MNYKNLLCTIFGVISAAISYAFGGWDYALSTLIICMAVDYLTGVACAAVFHNSPKTKSGGLNSGVGWQGLVKKGVTLLIVSVAYHLDLMLDSMLNISYIRDTVIFAFIANELLSIIENYGLMGGHMPDIITKAIDLLNKQVDGGRDDGITKRH